MIDFFQLQILLLNFNGTVSHFFFQPDFFFLFPLQVPLAWPADFPFQGCSIDRLGQRI